MPLFQHAGLKTLFICMMTGLLLVWRLPATAQVTVTNVTLSAGPYCEGSPVTVSYTVSGALGGATFRFDIMNNGGVAIFSDILIPNPVHGTPLAGNGTFSDVVTLPAGSAGGNRRIRVTREGITGDISGLSPAITINTVSGGGTAAAAQTICSGSQPTGLSVTGFTGTVVKWQRSSSSTFASGITDINVAAATLPSASIGTLTSTTYFRAAIQNGGCALAYSTIVAVTVNTVSPGTIAKGATNPGPGCAPLDPNISSVGVAASGAGTLSYAWQQSTDNGANWVAAAGAVNAGGDQFNPDPMQVTTRFRRMVSSVLNGITCTAYSNELEYVVYPAPLLTTPTPNPPANTVCAGSTVTLNTSVSGGTAPFNYQWTLAGTPVGPNANSYTITNISAAQAGTYLVTVTDANSCTHAVQRTINVNAVTFPAPVVTAVSCFGGSTGKIVASATGAGTISYAINPSAGTQSPAGTFNNLTANTYTITATDAATGCQASRQATVSQPAQLAFSFSKTDVSSCITANGTIAFTASGGTAPYQYSVNNGVTYQSGSSFTGLAAGSYSLKVRDAGGCESQVTVSSLNPPSNFPSVNAGTPTNVTCPGGSNGTITFNGSGGTSPYTYSIDNGASYLAGNNPMVFSGLAAASYQLKVKDANGCESAAVTSVVGVANARPNGVLAGGTICEGQQGKLTFTATAGNAPFILTINGVTYNNVSSGVPFNVAANPVTTTTYTLTLITDAQGCSNP